MSGRAGEVVIGKDAAELAVLAADRMAQAIAEAVNVRGVARIAISGGTTPSDTYRRLATLALPWNQTEWFWVDERAGAVDSARSNFSKAIVDLASAAIPKDRIHRMEAEDPNLEGAALRYERLLRRTFGVANAVAFDAMTLGIGDDGHTASLFPGIGAAQIDDRLVAAIAEQPVRGLEARLTLTAPVIQAARLVVVLARGASKAKPLADVQRPGSIDEVPARIILKQREHGHLIWVVGEELAQISAGLRK